MIKRIRKTIRLIPAALVLTFGIVSTPFGATTIPSGFCIPYPGTNASIPSGWSRKTGLDTFYIQGAGAGADADLTTSRGAATHTHTAPSTTIVQNSHTHTFTAGASNGTVSGDCCATGAATDGHTHASTTSNSATATNQAATPTISTNTSNDLPYKKVIWIESDGSPTGIPSNAYTFFESDTLPSSWTRVMGDTYPKGADASGDGGATGGSATHTHPGSISVTQNAHSHSAKASSGGSASGAVGSDPGSSEPANKHTHSVSLNNATATNQTDNRTSSSTNHEPVYKKINIINNGTGGVSLPNNIVGIWTSTNASIPASLSRLTAMDGYFPKGANADGESMVTTGGSTTHTHTITFQPTQDTHNHGSTAGAANLTRDIFGVVLDAVSAGAGHTHTWTIGNTVATNQSTVVNINANTSEDAYPPYRRVIFVKLSLASGQVMGVQLSLFSIIPCIGAIALAKRKEDEV